MTDLVVFGASCVVVGLAAGVLIGLWAPPPRRREALPPLVAVHDVTPPRHLVLLTDQPVAADNGVYMRVVAPPAEPPCFIDAEALGWLGGA